MKIKEYLLDLDVTGSEYWPATDSNRNTVSISVDVVVKAVISILGSSNFMVNISSSIDKTDLYLFGAGIPGINQGNAFVGWKSKVANPTVDADFYSPYGWAG